MANPPSHRAVYKHIDEQEIDVDIYLPRVDSLSKEECPILINIHGGAFMLGSSKMVNKDQVQDCLERGWIVLAPNHRLCPQVNLLEGPYQDCRDLLMWVHDGGLQDSVDSQEGPQKALKVDLDHVFAFGTSSGGTLALCLGFDVPHPVAGIYSMYGPCSFSSPFWSTPLPHIAAKLPKSLAPSFLNKVFDSTPVPITGGVSLEGQAPGPPDFGDPRQAYVFTQIASGNVMHACFPSHEWEKVDPILNIGEKFPPTFIVHGDADTMVPIGTSKLLLKKLQQNGVKCGMEVAVGQEHTFAAKMVKGEETWTAQREGFDFLASLTM